MFAVTQEPDVIKMRSGKTSLETQGPFTDVKLNFVP